MRKHLFKTVFFLFLITAACHVTDQEGKVYRVHAPDPKNEIFGSVNGREIGLLDLENATRRRLHAIRQAAYGEKKAAFEAETARIALAAAAEKRGLSAEELLRLDVDVSSAPLAAAEAERFIRDNSGDFQNILATEFPEALKDSGKGEQAVQKVVLASLKKRYVEKAREEYVRKLVGQLDVRFFLTPPEPLRQSLAVLQSPTYGPSAAPIQIVEFGSYGDPLTAKMEESLAGVMREKPGQIEWVFMHLPRAAASESVKRAHALAACAHHLGNFWGLHRVLVAHASALNESQFSSFLKEAGILETQMKMCLDRDLAKETLARDRLAADDVGIVASPAFFVNGVEVTGVAGPQELARVIENEGKTKYLLAIEKVR